MIEATIYKALGDPIRLEIVKRLSVTSTSTVGDISTNLGITRQGARKQLQVLVNANVVHLEQCGRQTQVSLNTKTLQIAQSFISQLERKWDNRLEALKNYVEASD
ncbi:helix-turn-helix transcriptional regulator [Aliiglaciecola sp. 3_MG-2023]|uniref:ArsR/SmtB family transcription factor n=1 Tax=Aliiglaciecola sp. 3_MG-2023 TaxID=3062644 RepID=UPI0026E36980|nr:helix-turn-helix transcriptional regulator [Aliiglaciecola sp. 3_MG-2023]MDO6692676.1 helix-turn-helix transcriptional regulator [Aliiglaciecola sp. 3_MG-2023]